MERKSVTMRPGAVLEDQILADDGAVRRRGRSGMPVSFTARPLMGEAA